MRDQARPQARPRAAASTSRRSSASSATSTAARWARWRRRRRWRPTPSFAPMLPGFRSVPLDDPEALRDAVGERTAAVMIEPIQGEAGIYPVPDETLAAAREACDGGRRAADLRRDPDRDGEDRLALGLRADAGAPGRDHHREGARRRAADRRLHRGAASARDVLEPGDHGSTFAGGPLVATAALAVLEHGRRPRAAGAASGSSGRSCATGSAAIDGVREVRGRGLMLGVGLEEGIDAAALAAAAAASRAWSSTSPSPGTLRLLPPLVISDEEAERARAAIEERDQPPPVTAGARAENPEHASPPQPRPAARTWRSTRPPQACPGADVDFIDPPSPLRSGCSYASCCDGAPAITT